MEQRDAVSPPPRARHTREDGGSSSRGDHPMEAILLPVVLADDRGNILDVNQPCERLFGYKREEMIGRNVKMLMPEDVAGKHDGYMAAFRDTGKTNLIGNPRHVLVRHKTGAMVNVEICLGLDDSNPSKVLLGATFRRIRSGSSGSGTSRNEESGDASVAQVATDREMKIVRFNHAAERLFKWRASEVLGKPVTILMPEPYRSDHDKFVERYERTKERRLLGIPRELLARRKDGSTVRVELSLGDSRDPSSGSTYVATFQLLDRPADEETSPSETFVARYCREYREVGRLGKGGFGVVYKVQHVINAVALGVYAVKKVAIGDSQDWLRKVLREVKMHERLRHPNCIAYKHAWVEFHRVSDFGPETLTLFILMEYANSGNLADFLGIYSDPKKMAARGAGGGQGLAPTRQYLSESHIWQLFLDVCRGLQYLHRNGVLHRDLKPENLLLHTSFDSYAQRDVTRLLISDFGTSAIESTLRHAGQRSGCTGTVGYMAPELVTGTGVHSRWSDCWSLGIVLYALCYSRVPYPPAMAEAAIARELASSRAVEIPSYPPRSDVLRNVLRMLLHKDSEHRWDVEDVLRLPVIQKIEGQIARARAPVPAPSASAPNSRRRQRDRSAAVHGRPAPQSSPAGVYNPHGQAGGANAENGTGNDAARGVQVTAAAPIAWRTRTRTRSQSQSQSQSHTGRSMVVDEDPMPTGRSDTAPNAHGRRGGVGLRVGCTRERGNNEGIVVVPVTDNHALVAATPRVQMARAEIRAGMHHVNARAPDGPTGSTPDVRQALEDAELDAVERFTRDTLRSPLCIGREEDEDMPVGGERRGALRGVAGDGDAWARTPRAASSAATPGSDPLREPRLPAGRDGGADGGESGNRDDVGEGWFSAVVRATTEGLRLSRTGGGGRVSTSGSRGRLRSRGRRSRSMSPDESGSTGGGVPQEDMRAPHAERAEYDAVHPPRASGMIALHAVYLSAQIVLSMRSCPHSMPSPMNLVVVVLLSLFNIAHAMVPSIMPVARPASLYAVTYGWQFLWNAVSFVLGDMCRSEVGAALGAGSVDRFVFLYGTVGLAAVQFVALMAYGARIKAHQ